MSLRFRTSSFPIFSRARWSLGDFFGLDFNAVNWIFHASMERAWNIWSIGPWSHWSHECMNFIFPTQYVIHRSLKVKWCLSEWISDLKSCSSTLFNSFVTLLTPLPFPSFARKGPFLSSFHHIHPNLSRFLSHLGAISDIRVLRSGLRPRSGASSGTRRSGMRRWAASVEVDRDRPICVDCWYHVQISFFFWVSMS